MSADPGGTMTYLFKIDLGRINMNNLSEILDGYKEAVENKVWELVQYVTRNRRSFNFVDVRMRCEDIVKTIDEYIATTEKAKAIVAQMAKEIGNDRHREVAKR